MTGFTEIIDQPAEPLQANGVEQAKQDLLDLMGQHETPVVDSTPEADDEPQELEAEERAEAEQEVQEGPEDEALQGPQDDELLDQEYWNRKVRFKENGEEVERTVKGLIEGFQLSAKDARTANELAEERKRLEAEFNGVAQARQFYEQKLSQIQQEFETLIPQEPDWTNMSQEEYSRKKPAWDQLQAQRNAKWQELQQVQQESAQVYQQQMLHYLQAQNEALMNRHPELSDTEERKKFFAGLTNYAANSYGFTPQELSMVNDHRLWDMAHKAMKYDELQQGAQGKQSGGKKNIPPLTKGNSPNDKPSSRKLREARSAFAKSGDTRDAAKLIEMNLAGLG